MVEPDSKRLKAGAGDPVKVCVTGAAGFIASHIVKQLLEKGYHVRGTVRDAEDQSKTAHLFSLAGASERLQVFSAQLMEEGSYDEAISGCAAVFHAASPLPVGKGSEDPENIVVKPAVEGTLNVLRSCKKAGSVRTVIMTSSMSAMAPVPEPALKTEDMWSDPDEQRKRGSHYGAGKTLAERAAYKFVEEEHAELRLVTICPTMVVGPMLQPVANMTMLSLRNWLKNGRSGGRCPNDSMSFVDVRDCASQHITALETESLSGRFMSLDCSWHWNDLHPLMRKLHPAMPDALPCDGEPCIPTKFDKTRQESLGVQLRAVPQILEEAAAELKAKGLLDE